jgi:DNA ligase-1
MSKDGSPNFVYHVFDLHTEPEPWATRFQRLQEGYLPSHISVLEHKLIEHPDDLLTYEAARTAEGYEGVILRKPDGHYKFGRSTAKEGLLLKLKRFEDSEAVVLEVIEEMFNGNEATTNELGRTKRSSHKENKHGKGRMGALLVKDVKTGVEFQIGTGFNDNDKVQFWEDRFAQPGALTVKYKFFPVGVKDKPRHPVYLGLRDKRDL